MFVGFNDSSSSEICSAWKVALNLRRWRHTKAALDRATLLLDCFFHKVNVMSVMFISCNETQGTIVNWVNLLWGGMSSLSNTDVTYRPSIYFWQICFFRSSLLCSVWTIVFFFRFRIYIRLYAARCALACYYVMIIGIRPKTHRVAVEILGWILLDEDLPAGTLSDL